MKLDMDKFNEIMDDFLTANEVCLLLTMPEGTQKVSVEDNTGLGPVLHFFFLLNATESICNAMQKQMGFDRESEKWRKVVDTLLGMIRAELLPDTPKVYKA